MHGLRLSSFGLRGFAGKSPTPEVVIDFAAAFGTFLVLAPDYDRMRDPGRHVFEHRVVPYAGRWQDAGIVELAEAFHTPLPLGRVTIRDICKLTGANRNTVKVHLKTLVQRRLLFREGTGKGSWYRP